MIDKLSNFSYFCFFLQGLNFLIPVLDKIKYVQSLKEIAIDIPEQSAITNGEGTNWVNKLVNIQAWNSMEGGHDPSAPGIGIGAPSKASHRLLRFY